MNKEESKRLLDEIRHNDSIRNKVIRLAKICSVLENVDLTKTRTIGALSKDFIQVFGKDFPKNGKISEKIAFFEFLTNNLTLKDFRKKIEHLEYKVKGITNNHAGALLELIIVDVLSRKGSSQNQIKHRKGPTEIDGEYKVDMITSYKYLANKFNLGVQLTISDGLKARKKNKKIKNIVHKIDSGKNGAIFGNKMILDSMIYIKLNGKIAKILENSPDIINVAMVNWQQNKFNGNILDYIEDKSLTEEINRFCDTYLLILDVLFNTLENELKNYRFRHKIIKLPTGEIIDINYSEREKYIKFNIGENGKQLFSMNFFLNNKIIEKLNPKSEEEINDKLDSTRSTILTISEYNNNDTIRDKIDKIAESKAVMKKIDKIKTIVWGVLSENYLEKRNIVEIHAFHEYISSIFELKDFENSAERIIGKANSILSESDGYILEFILLETLLRMNSQDSNFGASKGTPVLDSEFKTDIITSIIENGENYKFGNQITTTLEHEYLNDKDIAIKSVLSKIDGGLKKGRLSNITNIDSIILIQLNGIFSKSLHKPISPLKQAYKKWRKKNFEGNIIDCINKKELSAEIRRFCKLYSFIMKNYLKIVIHGIDKMNINGNSIDTNDGEVMKLFYSKIKKTLKFSLYEGEKFLFSMKFYLNQKLLEKINGNSKSKKYLNAINS